MKKILTGLIAISVLSTGLFAAKYPDYKTSLAIELGANNTSLTQSSAVDLATNGNKIFDGDSNKLLFGLNFKMEEKINRTHFYYGFGADFNYSRVGLKYVDMDVMNVSLYPTISYNFNRKLSANVFAGLNYKVLNLDDSNLSSYSLIDDDDFGYIYGFGVDYSLGTGVTHGLVYKKYEGHEVDVSEIDQSYIAYRIGIKF